MLDTHKLFVAVRALVAAAVLAGLAQPALAQDALALKATVETALARNPDVAQRLHAYEATQAGLTVARSAGLPRLDLNAEVGHDSSATAAGRTPFGHTGLGLNLSQVLWDGMSTRHDVARASRERASRYFELLDTTEQAAFEAVRVTYDVQRNRELVALAQANLEKHQAAVEKISSRVKAGVGRGVDLEQALARLALAQSTLLAEQGNLSDASTRFERVVGEPATRAASGVARLASNPPEAPAQALTLALNQSAAVSASLENLAAAREAVRTRQSALQPRVEARLRGGAGSSYESVPGRRNDASAQIVLNWNLFDGGADQSRVQQQVSQLRQAQDQLDKVCRDTRQNVLQAQNELHRLGEQMDYLQRNAQAIDHAREAYMQQFDIGQRSLLDLLNSESESYSAQRALVNGRVDLAAAAARTHLVLGQLLAQLGIAPSAVPSAAPEAAADPAETARCPAERRQLPNPPAPQAMPTGPSPSAAPMPAPQAASPPVPRLPYAEPYAERAVAAAQTTAPLPRLPYAERAVMAGQSTAPLPRLPYAERAALAAQTTTTVLQQPASLPSAMVQTFIRGYLDDLATPASASTPK